MKYLHNCSDSGESEGIKIVQTGRCSAAGKWGTQSTLGVAFAGQPPEASRSQAQRLAFQFVHLRDSTLGAAPFGLACCLPSLALSSSATIKDSY